MSDSFNQLPLNFKILDNKTIQEFIAGKNHDLIESLESFFESDESLFYFWGESASGKTHVLQAFTQTLTENGKSVVIISPEDINKRENISLIEMFDIICIDEVETTIANKCLEEALFNWINEVRQAHKKIVLSSQISNHSHQWNLPDLKSRLQSGRTYEIFALERNQAFEVFKQQAEVKGIVIDVKIAKYLQNNCPMNLKFLDKLLKQLDEVTLIQKKHVTIPLLKKILQTVLVD